MVEPLGPSRGALRRHARPMTRRPGTAPRTPDRRHQFLRFCVVGASGYAINIAAFAAALALSAEHLVAAPPASGSRWPPTSGSTGTGPSPPATAASRSRRRASSRSARAFLFAAGMLELLVGLAGLRAARPARLGDRGDAAQLPRQPGLVLHGPGADAVARPRTRRAPTPGWWSRPTTRPRTSSPSCARCCRDSPRPPASTGC